MSDPSSTPAPVEQPAPEATPAPKLIDLKALLRPIPPHELEAP